MLSIVHYSVQFSSVHFSCSVMSNSLGPHELQHARPPCPSPTPGVYPNSCPLSWWCHLTTSSSVVPVSSETCMQDKKQQLVLGMKQLVICNLINEKLYSLISSVQLLSHIQLFASPRTTACQASLSFTISLSLLKVMSIKLVLPSNHLIPCCPFLLLFSTFPSIRVFSNELALHLRWPKYWSFSFSISTSNEYSRLTSFRIDWFDLLAVQGTLKSFSNPRFKVCKTRGHVKKINKRF